MSERLCRAALVVLLVFFAGGLGAIARSQPERPDVISLVATSSSAKDGFPAKALVGSTDSDEVLAWRGNQFARLRESNGTLTGQRVGIALQEVNGPHAVALERRGRIIAAVKSKAQFFDPDGAEVRSFPIPFSESITTLSNGDFAISSPTSDGLIHVYSWLGAQRAHIGRLKEFDRDQRENVWLNRGIVLAGPDDGYIYVFANSPRPTVQHLSSDGALVSEFEISGASVNEHLEDARRFLDTRQADDIGGFRPILTAAFAPKRGTLLVGTTARRTGWESIYEYTLTGAKVAEYSLTSKSGSNIKRPIDYLVQGDRLILSDEDETVHVFHLPTRSQFDRPLRLVRAGMGHVQQLAAHMFPPLMARAPCPAPVGVPACQTGQCNIGGMKDCKAFFCNATNCGAITQVSCNSSFSSCTEEGTHCENDVSGNAVTTNIGPVTLACPKDQDGDGYQDHMEGGSDCRDDDSSIHPGATVGTCEQVGTGEDVNCNGQDDQMECQTPIVIDVLGDGFNFTTKANGVQFDLVGKGYGQQYSWTAARSDDVWLAMDRNGNGRIDSGKELWGAPTDQPPSHSRNGYIALAEFDLPANGGNDDRVIDAEDSIWSKLLLWNDANHDGHSQPNELTSIGGSSIRSLDLDFREFRDVDAHGNWFRYKAPANAGGPRWMTRASCDVYLWAK